MSDNWMQRLIVVDIETNGCKGGCSIDSSNHQIVQLSALPLMADAATSFDAVVKPTVHIPAASTAIHGITNDMAASAATFAVVWAKFERYVATIAADLGVEASDMCLCAHNMSGFDGPLLNRHVREATGQSMQYHLADTLPPFRQAFPDLAGDTPYSLPYLYNTMTGKIFHTAHNALEDCNALRELMIKCPDVLHALVKMPADTFQYAARLRCNNELLTAIKYIGGKRASRIADFLRREQWRDKRCKTIGGLRAYFKLEAGVAPGISRLKALETMLRTDGNIFSDAQLNCIMQQIIARPWTVHEHGLVPYFNFRRFVLHDADVKMLWDAGVRSCDGLREMYMYTCNEHTPTFKKLLRGRTNLSELVISQIAREVI